MAVPTFEELVRELDKKYYSGQITIDQYKQGLDDLAIQFAPPPVTITSPQPVSRNVVQYAPQSDVFTAQQKAGRQLKAEELRRGKTEEEAHKTAIEKTAKITRPTTTEYIDPAEFGISSVDLEKGIAYDEKGRALPAGFFEKAFAPFQRQITGMTPEAKKAYEDAIKQGGVTAFLTELLAEPTSQTGQIVETPTATGLRYLNMVSGVVAAGVQQFIPDVNLESDEYRVADSETFWDQALLNMAKDQGMGALYREAYVPEFLAEYGGYLNMVSAIFPITEAISGGDKRTQAFLLGNIAEVPYPVVPFAGQASKGTQKGLRVLAQNAAENGNIARAKRLYTIAHPIEGTALKGVAAKVASDAKGFGINSNADDILQDVLENIKDTTPQQLRQNVRDVSADKIANRLNTIEQIKVIEDPQDLTAYINNPTMNSLWRKIDTSDTVSVDKLLPELRKVATEESNKMRKFAIESAKQGETKNLALFNEAEAIAKFTKEAGRLKAIDEDFIKTMNSPLLTDYLDELGKIQLGLRAGEVLVGDTKLGAKLTVQDLILDAVRKKDMSSIMQAGKNTISKKISEKWLNFLPDDLHVVTGNMVVPTRIMKDKKLLSKYAEENKKVISKIQPENVDDDFVAVGSDIKDKLIRDFISYAGADKIRQSESMQDILLGLKNGRIEKQNLGVITQAVQSKNAQEVLGATPFKGGGEQFRRARVPVEAKQDIIATTREKEFQKQIVNGRLGQLKKDWVAARRAITTDANTPIFVQTVEDVDSDLLNTIKVIDSKRVQIPSQFDDELKMRMDQYSNEPEQIRFAMAMDDMMAEVHQAKVEPRLKMIDDNVQRGFNGDWVEYLHLFYNDKYGHQIVQSLGGKSKGGIDAGLGDITEMRVSLEQRWAKEAVAEGMNPIEYVNIKVKDAIIDYERFEETVREWSALVKDYYGEDLLSKAFGSKAIDLKKSVKFKNFIVVGGDKRFYEGGKDFEFLSKKSSYFDISYTNFLTVLDRLERSEKALRGRGLKDVKLGRKGLIPILKTEKNVVYTPTRWIQGAREGKLVQKEMEEYFKRNPQKRANTIEETTSISGQDNYWVLDSEYDTILSEIPLLQNTNIKPMLVSMHIDVLSKIGTTSRQKLLENFFEIMGNATVETKRNTVWPDLKSMRGAVYSDYMEAPLRSMRAKIAEQVKFADVPIKERDAVTKQIFDKASDLLLFGKWGASENKYLTAPTYSAIEDSMRQIGEHFRAQGIVSGDRIITETIDQYPKLITDSVLKSNPQIEIIGGIGLLEDYKRIMDLGKEGKLTATMDRLRAADQGSWEIVKVAIQNTIDATRRIATQGMLSGFPIPNFAYHGQNIVTQPILGAMTLGWGRMAKSYEQLKLALTVKDMPRSKVALVSNNGRKYSAGELADLANEYNIGMTRADIELYIGNVNETLRNVNIKSTGEARKINPIGKAIDPRYRTIWSRIADSTDMSYRRSVFYQALKEDMPIDQAVDLAQKSLLDYGAMSKFEKATANKYVMFWSFSRQSTSEFINSIGKAVAGDNGHKALITLARTQQRQHQAAGDSLYEDDRQRARLFKYFAGESDNLPMYNYGFSNPYVEGFEGIVGAMNMAMMIGEGRFGEAFTSISFRPENQVMIDALRGKEYASVPPDFVYGCKAMGVWDLAREFFDITERPKKQRRVQEPIFGEYESQYEFIGKGAGKFKFFQLATVLMGIDRFMRETSRTAMAMDDPEEMKRFASTNPIVYLLGIARPLKTVDPYATMRLHQKNIERELDEITKDLEKK